ncbi:MAG: hypothetical protein OER88_08160 [Planctomycetota bacterium]|nr:hypothetical protein [Planctomycetota bacterium]
MEGQRGAALRTVLVGGACLLALIAGVYTWVMASRAFPGERISVFEAEIYYSGDTTEADARKLADVLKEAGYLGGTGEKTVHIDRTDGSVSVGLVLAEGWDDPKIRASVRATGAKIAAAGFGSPLTMNLHDQTGDLRSSVRVE